MKKGIYIGVILAVLVWSFGIVVTPVAATTISDGDLVKVAGSSSTYLIQGSTKRVFPHAAVYHSWGYPADYSTVKTITTAELASYTDGDPVCFRDGSLFRGTAVSLYDKESSAVFVVEDTKLRPIKSETVYTGLYGTDGWGLITWVPDSLLTKFDYPLGTDVTSSATHTNGTLVKYAGSTTVYVLDNGTKREISSAGLTANGYVRNGVYMVPLVSVTETYSDGDAITGVETALTTPGTWGSTTLIGDLTIGLNANNPVASSYISKGAQNAIFAKFNLTAASGDVTVSKVVLQRKGLGYDADVDTVRLYDGSAQIGSDQSINTTTHKVTFTGFSWKITSGTTKTLSVKANIASSPSGTNDYFELTEVTADGSVSGLPVAGNALQFSALSVGQLNVTSVSGSSTVISGETNVELGCWNLNTSSTEGFDVESVKLTNIGSGASGDASNFLLRVGSTDIEGATAASMDSDGTITFDLTNNPYQIDYSKTKKVCLYGDVTAGITVSKTLIFQVAEAKHVIARGQSSAGEVLITYSGGTAFVSQSAKTCTINQGSATLAQNSAYAPTTGTAFVKGVIDNKMAAYKLTAGPDEGVRLTKLRLTLAGTNVANTDFSNWKLYKIVDGEEVDTNVYGSVSGLTVTFEDTTTGLLDVAKSQNETIVIKADVSTSAAGNETGAHVYVGTNGTTNTVARIKGLDSDEYITSGVTLSGVATGNAQTFTIDAYGALVVSKASDSPSSDTVAKGTSNYHFTTINLYATGEDMEVTDLSLTSYETSNQTDVTDSGEISNVYITNQDGEQLGTTCSTPSTGVCDFSFSYTVPKNENKKIKVYADVPSGSTASYLHVDMKTVATDITTAGGYSAADITETGTAQGSTMTVGSPTLVAAMLTTPITSSYVVNDTGVTVGKLTLTAGTTESVKVTSIKISTDDASGITGASFASLDITNVHLVNANSITTQYGLTKNFTDGTTGEDYANFTGINNLTVPKGETVTINIVADIYQDSQTGTPTYYFGVLDASTDVTGTGASSSASATVTPNGSAVESTGVTLRSAGDLIVAKAADMPASTQIVSGTTGNELAKYKLTAQYEDVDVRALTLTLSADVSADIANVKLYKDGVQFGDVNGYAFSTTDKAINLTSGTLVIPKDINVTLTIKADMNAKAQVTTSATSRYIGLKNASGTYDTTGTYTVTAYGAKSGTAVSSINDSSGNIYRSNAFTIHKGILTVSNVALGTTTGIAASDQEVMKFSLTATGDDIEINEMEFCAGGSYTNVQGTSSTIIKDSTGATTYATLTQTVYDTYWDAVLSTSTTYYPMDPGVTNASCFSFGDDTGTTSTKDMVDFSTTIEVAAGTSQTFIVYGDLTSDGNSTTNKTHQLKIGPNSASSYKATTSGIEYQDSSGTDIDLTTTKNLPVNGTAKIF